MYSMHVMYSTYGLEQNVRTYSTVSTYVRTRQTCSARYCTPTRGRMHPRDTIIVPATRAGGQARQTRLGRRSLPSSPLLLSERPAAHGAPVPTGTAVSVTAVSMTAFTAAWYSWRPAVPPPATVGWAPSTHRWGRCAAAPTAALLPAHTSTPVSAASSRQREARSWLGRGAGPRKAPPSAPCRGARRPARRRRCAAKPADQRRSTTPPSSAARTGSGQSRMGAFSAVAATAARLAHAPCGCATRTQHLGHGGRPAGQAGPTTAAGPSTAPTPSWRGRKNNKNTTTPWHGGGPGERRRRDRAPSIAGGAEGGQRARRPCT